MQDSPTRAERRAQDQQQRRSRAWVAIGTAVVVVVVAVVVGVLVFSGGDDASDDGGQGASRSVANTNVSLEAGEVTADSAGPPVTVSPEITARVIDLIGDYLEIATVEPLRNQQPAGDLSGIFETAALARATGADRAVLVDEGLPAVTGDLDVVAKPVAITGLGDQSGNLVLVTATVDLDINGETKDENGQLHIKRFGSIVLTPDPAGAWKVSAYRLYVERSGGGLGVATTAAAGTGR